MRPDPVGHRPFGQVNWIVDYPIGSVPGPWSFPNLSRDYFLEIVLR